MVDLQKASLVKRIGALLVDLVFFALLVYGGLNLFGRAVNYSTYTKQMDDIMSKYGQEYGVDFDISAEEFEELSDEEIEKYNAASEAINNDEAAMEVYNTRIRLELMMASSSLLLAYTVLEILLPLILRNGQTIGKKMFSLCLMHKDGYRVGALQVCFRALLGKYLIETMVPVMIYALKRYGKLGTTGSLIMGGLVMAQAFILIYSRANCAIHDKLCKTVVVDQNEQVIFETREDWIAYEEQCEAENAEA